MAAIDDCIKRATENFKDFCSNPYPGRAIVAGLDYTGKRLVQGYLLTGRSENSRNRVLILGENGRVFTKTADPAKVVDPKLIIYNAMREEKRGGDGYLIVSNGDQTDAVADYGYGPLRSALATHTYEPDAPNYTARITAMSSFDGDDMSVQMSILRRSPFGELPDTFDYLFENLHPGLGWYIATYSGDGNPLPPFTGEPQLMPLAGTIEDVATQYWIGLPHDNRIAVAFKFVDIKTGESRVKIINKYKQV